MKPTETAIIGAGFCGLMTAVQLVRHARAPIHIYLINEGAPFGKGIAYSTGSPVQLLNVPVERMSCFPGEPDHFLQWLNRREAYRSIDKDSLGKMYVPRHYYGEYLLGVWSKTLADKPAYVQLDVVNEKATAIVKDQDGYFVQLQNGSRLHTDYAVLATGNEAPGNPSLPDESVFAHPAYFRNPWSPEAVKDVPSGNVLIIGNGLTMVDTTLELLNKGFTGRIFSISPHGFTVLPHRYSGVTYTKLSEEIKAPYHLNELFRLFRKHVRLAREIGLSAEPVADSLRGISQQVWMALPAEEKRRFLVHLRHLWGLARHRLPLNVYDRMQELKRKGTLVVTRGRLKALRPKDGKIEAFFRNTANKQDETLEAVRVINCTGPLSDITRSENPLLQQLLRCRLVCPDEFRLGIATDLRGAVIDGNGCISENIFTLGSSLRGLLWETTAVPELRVQAEKLALLLLEKSGQVRIQP